MALLQPHSAPTLDPFFTHLMQAGCHTLRLDRVCPALPGQRHGGCGLVLLRLLGKHLQLHLRAVTKGRSIAEDQAVTMGRQLQSAGLDAIHYELRHSPHITIATQGTDLDLI